MNWQIIIQSVSATVVAIFGFYQIWRGVSRPRNYLKQDLEILKLLDPESDNFKFVKERIDNSIKAIYQDKMQKGNIIPLNYWILDLCIGTLSTLSGIFWAIFLLSPAKDHTWIIFPILLIVGGLAEIMVGLNNKS